MELFPGLSRDLGRQCLLRVHYKSHQNLTAVCRSWKDTVKSPKFYQDRKDMGTSQQIICLFEIRERREYVITVYDPLEGTWETLPRLPHYIGCHDGIPLAIDYLSVNQRLVLMGGYNPFSQIEVNSVFIYDFSSGKWSRGADMPVFRKHGALSESPEGLVYVAGGMDADENFLRGAAVYSVDEDEWKLLPDMSQERFNCRGHFRDGKFYVVDGGDLTEVYDPKRGAWTTIPKEEGPPPPEIRVDCSVGARSFSVEMQQGMMEYDSKEKVWRTLCSFPETIGGFTFLVGWRDRVFVAGHAKDTSDEVFYMWTPPPIGTEAGAQGESFGKWDAIEKRPAQHSHVNVNNDQFIEDAFTVDV